MRNFVAVTFDDPYRADEVLATLARLQSEYLLELEDAVVARKTSDGKVKIRQTMDMTAGRGAVRGGLWGGLVGMLFFAPLVGAAIGAGSGALSGRVTDLGIDDRFVREVANDLTPGSSAIFVVAHDATPDKVMAALEPFKGKVYQTSLTQDAEDQLKKLIEQQESMPA